MLKNFRSLRANSRSCYGCHHVEARLIAIGHVLQRWLRSTTANPQHGELCIVWPRFEGDSDTYIWTAFQTLAQMYVMDNKHKLCVGTETRDVFLRYINEVSVSSKISSHPTVALERIFSTSCEMYSVLKKSWLDAEWFDDRYFLKMTFLCSVSVTVSTVRLLLVFCQLISTI